ncbi:NAD(P)H-hydrate dehydratase [Alkalihalobacterium chitinilyticum]|uniref:Bifunctional NAD(P)H-hydrate repair enzyme n=1 Tax=Alkalihalobacterium chitinilyticum TaxID=2980103 RepID=A0ABT5VGJ1_9BACI|nr:NAD(P)H-hydrate dehydratase [Alkalihalobacterium chitinilyticum]MDE5414549.1 NAD(P)H-hydrate dehydratase [Alkalihalobacterium chitinilyticum]
MRIVTAAEMYKMDTYTIEKVGIREDTLMESAGQAVAKLMIDKLNPSQTIMILAGAGNNGGDGFVIARILKSYGYRADLWIIPPPEKIKGAAKHALDVYLRSGYNVQYFTENEEKFFKLLSTYDVIIDCLLGIGVKGDLRAPYNVIIKEVNGLQSAQVISVDVPSGVAADGGNVIDAIKADATITIQNPKVGAFTYPAASYYGAVSVVDIGIPPLVVDECTERKELWTEKHVLKHLPTRQPHVHKGTNGKALLIGGSREMTGAVMLSAKAALRSGAGLLTVAVPDVIHSIVATHLLEAMYLPCATKKDHFQGELAIDFGRFDAVAVGPGMGRTAGGQKVVGEVLQQRVPVVLDADALFHVTELMLLLKERKEPTVLTPHSGEMARLCGISIEDVEEKRFELSKQFAVEYGVYLVLKGPFTIVTTPRGEQFVNPTGNAGLAKGGSGDVLTGMILAFIMQYTSVQAAVSNAVFVHGKAADLLLEGKHTHTDIIATDVIEKIPNALKLFQP